MHRFYYPETMTSGVEVELGPADSHHLARVLRAREGDSIVLFDGKGSVATARLTVASPKRSRARIDSVRGAGAAPSVRLAFGIAKAAALDFIVRRAIELGVCSLVPLVSEHSSRASAWNGERWSRVAVEVAKQCEADFLPVLSDPESLASWLARRDEGRQLVYCSEKARLAEARLDPSRPVDLVVGAEGGWSEAELRLLAGKGVALGLGAHRLRAETAALVALTLVKSRMGELG